MTVSVHAPFDLVEAFAQRLAAFLGQQARQFWSMLSETHSASVQQFCTLASTYPSPFTLRRFGRSDDCVQLARSGLSDFGKDFFGCRVFNWDSPALALDELAIVVDIHC
ncbi:hypothetical protein D3C84_1079860 [compost metagenome]